MAHSVVEDAEKILDKEFPVLNKGFVRLVDYMGSDQRIVQAARVSYGDGTTSYRQDKFLIDYLLRNEHTSPFEQVVLTFHVKMPVFVARQWVRHRTGRLNEISGRYSVMSDEFYVPEQNVVSSQSKDNKQGRDPQPLPSDQATQVMEALVDQQKQAYHDYQDLIDDGLARELARINLPVSLYTQMYWQIDLHNLFHFLRLRMDPHAQHEIREYANTIYDITRLVCPMACASFDEHIREGVRFSATEINVLDSLFENVMQAARTAGLDEKQIDRLVAKIKDRRST